MQEHLEENRGPIDRVADVIANFSGSMGFVLVHVIWFVAWFLWNTGVIPRVKRFDPYPFILLAMIVSVEGVLLSTFVLMKQNRMQRKSDARDHVNLQIDLLAEKEVTKSLRLLRAICPKARDQRGGYGCGTGGDDEHHVSGYPGGGCADEADGGAGVSGIRGCGGCRPGTLVYAPRPFER